MPLPSEGVPRRCLSPRLASPSVDSLMARGATRLDATPQAVFGRTRTSVTEFVDLFSALIAAGVAFLTLTITFRNERKKSHAESQEKLAAFLGAVKTEIDTWWPIYAAKIGAEIESPGRAGKIEPLWISDNYFPVYGANAGQLGTVANDELRTQIVKTYAQANALFDSIRLNNYAYEEARPVSGSNKQGSAEEWMARFRYARIKDAVPVIQSEHAALKAEVAKLQTLLSSEIQRLQKSRVNG